MNPNDPVTVAVDAILESMRDRCEALRPEDRDQLRAIEAAPDMTQSSKLIMAYYRDVDRANRTPRAFLYLHLGWLAGMVDKLIKDGTDAQRARNHGPIGASDSDVEPRQPRRSQNRKG